MPTLEVTAQKQSFRNTINPLRGKALTTLDRIGGYAGTETTGDDALTVLNRKLEAAGVLASGSGAPVFANETALFYLDTATEKFYVRETSDYQEINNGAEESEIIGHGTTDQDTADASDPWIFINTDANKIWLKERTGSPGSYSYTWTGPIFEGDSRTEVVYNTADDPSALTVSWNWKTDTFSPTGGGWTGNSSNAKWAIIVTLPRNTNNAIASPQFRLKDTPVSSITFTAKDGTNNLPSSVNNLQELIDWLNTATLGGGGGGTGTDDQTAAEVPTTTSSFNNNLSATDTNVQRALDTLDNINFPTLQRESFARISGNILPAGITQNFTVLTSLTTLRSTYNEQLFIEATVDIRMQASVSPASATATFIFDVVTPADAGTGIQSDPLTLTEGSGNVDGQLRLSGVLPADFVTGKLRIRRTGTTGSPPAAGVEGIKLQIRSDVQADEVIVRNDDLGNNLTGDSNNLEEIISEIDELPIQPADYEDVPWPGGSNAIDDDGVEVRPDGDPTYQITFARNMQNANNRPGITYVAHISYDAVIVAGSGGAITELNFVHKTYAGNNALNEIQSSNETTGRGVQRKTYDVTVPTNTNSFTVGITNNANQSDGRLLITNYRVNFSQGIDASSFDGTLSMDDNTNQRVAQKVDDLSASNLPLNASTFDGNLATTDDTVQEVAQKFDDYEPEASDVTVVSNDFSDPNNFIGGLREVTGISGVPDTPANVQQALVKADYLLQEAYNPFQSTQLLDHSMGGGFSSTFTVNTTNPSILTNDIDIAAEVRDLGVPAAVRIRIRLQSLGAAFAGDLQLVHADFGTGSPLNTITYGDPEVINNTVYSGANAPPTYVTFQRTIPAPLPDTFKLRLRRTGGTTAAVFNDGFADVIDSTAPVMGGAGGQASSYTTTIIWLAGASIHDRLTTVSETTNYTLMSGHRFPDYDQLLFVFDAGAGSTQPLMPCWTDSNLFQSNGAAGILWIQGQYWLMVSRQSTTTFRFRWRAPSNGLRRIIGIKTN